MNTSSTANQAENMNQMDESRQESMNEINTDSKFCDKSDMESSTSSSFFESEYFFKSKSEVEYEEKLQHAKENGLTLSEAGIEERFFFVSKEQQDYVERLEAHRRKYGPKKMQIEAHWDSTPAPDHSESNNDHKSETDDADLPESKTESNIITDINIKLDDQGRSSTETLILDNEFVFATETASDLDPDLDESQDLKLVDMSRKVASNGFFVYPDNTMFAITDYAIKTIYDLPKYRLTKSLRESVYTLNRKKKFTEIKFHILNDIDSGDLGSDEAETSEIDQ